jgi:hypothetical protein
LPSFQTKMNRPASSSLISACFNNSLVLAIS